MRPGDPRWSARAVTAAASFRQAADRIDNGIKALREINVPIPEVLASRVDEFRRLADAIESDRMWVVRG